MHRTTNAIDLSSFLQLWIDMAEEDKVSRNDNSGNETNLSYPSTSKIFNKAGYLSSKGAKKGGGNLKRGSGNIKKDVKAAKGSNYLISGAKKTFNLLQHVFT